MKEIVHSYSDLSFHKSIGEMIKRRSENKQDIRSLAISMVDWTNIKNILDLGCGYGWFEAGLKGMFERVTGIDCLPENEQAFLAAAGRITLNPRFEHRLLPCALEMPDESFDLVVSAYSLYFFPEVIPEIKRVLKKGGFFLAITHSESMLQEGERFFDFTNLRKVIQGFSAENGGEILRSHFVDIQHVDFKNAIVFSRYEKKDLADYINFKREFISKDVDPSRVMLTMLDELERKGSLRFNKDDRIFLAKK